MNPVLKTGYIEFAQIESSVNPVHAVIFSPAVAMAAEVHCQRRATARGSPVAGGLSA